MISHSYKTTKPPTFICVFHCATYLNYPFYKKANHSVNTGWISGQNQEKRRTVPRIRLLWQLLCYSSRQWMSHCYGAAVQLCLLASGFWQSRSSAFMLKKKVITDINVGALALSGLADDCQWFMEYVTCSCECWSHNNVWTTKLDDDCSQPKKNNHVLIVFCGIYAVSASHQARTIDRCYERTQCSTRQETHLTCCWKIGHNVLPPGGIKSFNGFAQQYTAWRMCSRL